MMIRKQDKSAVVLYYMGYSRIRNLYYRIKKQPLTRFVAFHDIPEESLNNFQANLFFLKSKTNVVSFDDYVKGKLSTEKINVVITFDDGYKSWVTNALDILKKFELPATFFVSSGFVGLSKKAEEQFIKTKLISRKVGNNNISGGLDLHDLEMLVNSGFTIGGHTKNHSNMMKIQDTNHLRIEIADDKECLETITGRRIEYFAYPSGVFQSNVGNIAKYLEQLGYKCAVTTIPGFNRVNTDRFMLRRELTYASMPELVFRAKMYGNYDVVHFLKQTIGMLLQRQ